MKLGLTKEPFEIIPIHCTFVPTNQSRGDAFDNRGSKAQLTVAGAQAIGIPLSVPDKTAPSLTTVRSNKPEKGGETIAGIT